jgi:uncharacterized protein
MPEKRIGVLDVLRGIALFGMFLVHFKNFSLGGGGLDAFYTKIVDLLFEERFWAMFGILFGVGFAIQFRRAEARGDRYVGKYIRRLVALAVFGFIAEAVFGFNVLLSYAIWGIPLLLFRNWPPRTLIAAVILSAASGSLYGIARTAYGVATEGEQTYTAERKALAERNASFREAYNAASDDPSYSKVFSSRLQHMRWFYAQPFSFLPVNTLTLFLLGLLALRLGIFDRPEQHRRLIVALMIFGVASWSVAIWLFRNPSANAPSSLVLQEATARLENGFGLIRPMWLTFTYMGTVLLLVAHNPQWLQRLALFGYTGRMALTNYMIQIALLDLIFTKHGLGVMITPLAGLGAAIGLFLLDAAFSKWWLARFRYGPLEWLWRSITYWKKAELRKTDPGEGTISAPKLEPR